jgi:hypothetical protein
MLSTKTTRAVMFAATAATALIASQAMADILVMRASGPAAQRYRPGTLLPDVRPIRLGSSDVLELLSDTGTWTWTGPGDFPAATRTVRTSAGIAAPDLRRTRVGAVRSVGGATMRPNVWMVDLAEPGAVCVLSDHAPLLWRTTSEAAATTTITGPGGNVAAVEWSAGQAAAPWPASIPVVDGAGYRITGAGASIDIVVKQVSSPPSSLPAAGMALIERGCQSQIDVLTSQVERLDASAGS